MSYWNLRKILSSTSGQVEFVGRGNSCSSDQGTSQRLCEGGGGSTQHKSLKLLGRASGDEREVRSCNEMEMAAVRYSCVLTVCCIIVQKNCQA